MAELMRARVMMTSREGVAWNSDSSARNAGRRGWASTIWLVAGTLAVALTSYSLSLQVSNERRETDRLAQRNRALETDLKALDAELRVRMRMPQLQRWNDDVLGLMPISASQYLASPVRLADYGKPLPGDVPVQLPSVQLAVRDVPMTAAPLGAAPKLIATAAPSAPSGAIARPVAEPIAPVLASAEAAPADLLQQVEMLGRAPPGTDN